MIKYLRLQQQFNAAAMLQEAGRLAQTWWKEHYNARHYEGNWSLIPLRAPGGDPQNIFAMHASANESVRYADTPLLEQCPHIKAALDFFQCEKMSVRLMKLDAGAVILEHTDQDLTMEEGEARLHIPLQTNEAVDFYVADECLHLREGECWYLNLSLRHRVENKGTTDRLHLVIDCLVNDWLRELFATAELQKEVTDADLAPRVSREDQEKIIAHLREMNTTVSNELADKMQQELL